VPASKQGAGFVVEMEKNTTIEKLFEAGAHFGYAPSRRHPSLAGFIYGEKGGTELFDLEKTAECLERALEFIRTLAKERKTVLFVGGKAEARSALSHIAQRLSQPYCAGRFIGGTLTNFSEIRRRLNRLEEINSMREKGETQKFTKRERMLLDREAEDLEHTFGGLKSMQKLPDALFVVDPGHEAGAVAEAQKLTIPVVALMNSDCNRKGVTYPIPANDASIKSISFILEEVAEAYADNLSAAPDSNEKEGEKRHEPNAQALHA
jgi:small subunit ribosomal protein S2